MKLSLPIALMFSLASIVTMAAPVTEQKRGLKSCYSHATLTQYWIPKEGDKDENNDGDSVSLTGPKTKTLKTSSGKTIAKVSKSTYEKFQMEGTGLLKNGEMVNLDDGKNEFMTVDRSKDPYGVGSDDDIALVPWVSVAANDMERGTTLYIKDLDGVKLPDGKTHNGCVRVDDEGWSFDDCQLDFFVLQYSAYKALEDTIPEKVKVEKKECKVQNYVTNQVKKWAALKGYGDASSDDSSSDDKKSSDSKKSSDDKKSSNKKKSSDSKKSSDKKKHKHHDDEDEDEN
ncbi:hypothetical protein BJV82DRAFT_606745 [Fennellomyces sp. T-0311]|nr:hypothetical protein BJV82DRAFT_606745 [Fennellomyces sp. T-0311]